MRNDKNFRRRAQKGASIDGIVTDDRRLGEPLKPAKANKNAPAASLDSYVRRAEGFHPMRQASGGSLGEAVWQSSNDDSTDEPIILDEEFEPKNKPKKRHLSPRRLLKRSSIAVIILILLLGGYLAAKFVVVQRNILRGGGDAPALAQNVDINKLKGEGDGRINILLLGNGGPGHEAPDLTDTIMLASIDPINNGVALLSVPRDLWAKFPGD